MKFLALIFSISTVSTSIHINVSPSQDQIFAVPNQLGLSYEKFILSSGLFSAANTNLIGLYKALGPAVVRLGGSSVDKAIWDPEGAGHSPKVIAPADIDRLSAFIAATGWKVLYGINLARNSPGVAAAEALYVTKALGNQLIGFEIGNEPNLYHSSGVRPPTYSYQNFLTEWQAYAVAIRAAVPQAVLSGPATSGCCAATYTIPFATDEASQISILTQHYYRANGQLPTSTIDLLLAPDPHLQDTLNSLGMAARNANLPGGFRMAEANSFFN